MFYTIYKITNVINGKIYIGKHQTKNVNDSYYGSGKAIKDAIKKYGKENFEKEVLFVFDNEKEMNYKEKELITQEFVLREDTYNLGVGGEGGAHFKGKKHTRETVDKVNKNREFVEKRRKTVLKKYEEGELEAWNKGKSLSEKHREKICVGRKGKKHSPETIEKIKNARKKQTFSEETKLKMSESAKKRKK